MPNYDRGSNRPKGRPPGNRPPGNRPPPKKFNRSPKDSKAPMLRWAIRLFRQAKELKSFEQEPVAGQELLSLGEPSKLVSAYRRLPDARQRLRFEEDVVVANQKLGQQLLKLYEKRRAEKAAKSTDQA
jgi:hypothetical protein